MSRAGFQDPLCAAGVNLTPPGPGSFTATFLCITVGTWMMPWEDFPPKGLRLLGVDDAVVVVDGLRAAAGDGFGA